MQCMRRTATWIVANVLSIQSAPPCPIGDLHSYLSCSGDDISTILSLQHNANV